MSYLAMECANVALREGTLISIHELSLSLWLFRLRVTMIGMTNLLDDFQSDSRARDEKKSIFIARGG